MALVDTILQRVRAGETAEIGHTHVTIKPWRDPRGTGNGGFQVSVVVKDELLTFVVNEGQRFNGVAFGRVH